MDKVVGYKIGRVGFSTWIFGGTTPSEVAAAIESEIDMNEGLPVDECDALTIEPYETTLDEINQLPEFEGW